MLQQHRLQWMEGELGLQLSREWFVLSVQEGDSSTAEGSRDGDKPEAGSIPAEDKPGDRKLGDKPEGRLAETMAFELEQEVLELWRS